ncbi:MAG: class I SAM-dependent methyltransferase [Geminicoccaceae bacterium]
MSATPSVVDHYTRGNLLERLSAALADDGIDPLHPDQDALAPYDHFHGRGLEATDDLANRLSVDATDHILDVGCGIGGPARYMASRFGCRVTGIDLTGEFCDVARYLNGLLHLKELVAVEKGNALQMPFGDASFDGAYSMNVSMNITDKPALYTELKRVLKPGAWLVLSEMAQGPGGDVEFPTPWASSAETSFLSTPEATRAGLEAAGFAVSSLRDTTKEAKDYGARSRALVEQGEKPPHRAVRLIHGETADQASTNTARGLAEGRLIPIEVTCLKPH